LRNLEICISKSELLDEGTLAPAPFELLPIVDAELQQISSRKFCKEHFTINDEIKTPFSNNFGKNSRIKVGYFSSDFFNHATMHLLRKVFEYHDRDKFEIYVYCLNEINSEDPYTKYLIDNVEHFYPVKFVADREIAKLARSHGLDIAIDLKGYTKDSRTKIFAYRAAPIQINYLGYPGTMGAKFMDYILADEVIIPSSHKHFYDEEVLYLPGCYQVNDITKPVSKDVSLRSDWGLPDDALVLASFNNNYKITESELSIWMRILKHFPNTVLWIFEGNSFSRKNIISFAEKFGVSEKRLIFAQKAILSEHLERHQHIDIFLDTFKCNAHTTASDAIWSGVPIVTLEGETFCARVASSILKSVGLNELVATSELEYEEKIIELIVSPEKLKSIKEQISPVNRSSLDLFNPKNFTQNLENIFEEVIKEKNYE